MTPLVRASGAARRAAATVLAAGVVVGPTVLAVPASAASAGAGTAAVPVGVRAAAEKCEEGVTRYLPATPAALTRLGANRAWQLATGRGIIVAVVDSGVSQRNRHFPDSALVGGRSYVGGSPRTDERTHGTSVAGVIAARPVERSGVVGLARDALILPVKVVPDEQREEDGEVAVADLAKGIAYAADQGATIINVSLSTTADDPRLRDAVRHATERGALVVASAGNRRTAEDPADGPRYPAAYPQVVAVSAAGPDDRVTDDSVHGSHVDLVAPGRDVLTSWGAWGDCYLSQEGSSTSFATAYVSAAAALLAQRFPSAGPAGWKYRLEATAARDRRDARDDRAGWGMVQPVEALTAVLDDRVAGPVGPGAKPRPTETPGTERIAVGAAADPLVGDRRQVVWVAVAAGTAVLGLALVRLVRRRPTA
ncbi:S8 family serine peptidase [Oryzobacter terrae]|uniref:S8 family serine peptidase n=1 Tax=Oryzobacter terrae TaxID=1620385 RepID=UPI00366D682B